MTNKEFLEWKKNWTKDKPIPAEVIDFIADLLEIDESENRLVAMLDWMHKQNKLAKHDEVIIGVRNGTCW